MTKNENNAIEDHSRPSNKSVFLTGAKLKNYRTIESLEIDFEPGLNIIIGKNGAGKTNLVELLSFFLSLRSDAEHISIATGELLFEDWEGKPFQIHCQQLNVDGSEPLERKSLDSEIILSYSYFDGETAEKQADISDGDLLEKGRSFKFLKIKHGVPNNVPLFDARMDIRFDLRVPRGSFVQVTGNTHLPVYVRMLAQLTFLSFRSSIDEEEFGEEDLPDMLTKITTEGFSYIETVSNDLNRFTPIQAVRLAENPNVNVDSKNHSLLISNLHLEFLVNGDWLVYDQLSDGSKRLFLIVAEISFWHRYQELRREISKKGDQHEFSRIIIIEEPELGVHPHQLHLLMTYLREEAAYGQVIVTTHSPQVLNALDKDELDHLHIVSYDTEAGTRIRKPSESQIKEAISYMDENGMYLSDYWVHANLEPEF